MRCASICAFLTVLLAASIVGGASAASHNDIEQALARQDFATAKILTAALPDENDRSFNEIYIQTHELLALDRCDEATPLLEALGIAQPHFMPAHRLLYLCDMARNDTRSAAIRLDVMLAHLAEGPARDHAVTLRRNLAYSNGPIFNVFGEVVPTTNVGRQTSATDINGWTIADENRASMGAKLRAGGTATFSLYTAGSLTTTGVISGELETNTTTKQIIPRLSVELPTTVQHGNALFGAGPRLSLKFVKGELAETQLGGKAFASWQLGQGTGVRVDTQGYRAEHKTDAYLNATHLSAAVAYTFALSDSVSVTTRLDGSLDLYDHENMRRHTLEFGTSLDYAAPNGWLVGTGLSIGRRWHNQPPPMAVGDKQVDSFVAASGAIGHSAFKIGPVTPMLQYNYTKQWSDNVFYQYDSHDVGIKLRANL